MCALFNHQFTGRAAEAIRTHGADIVETQEGTYPMIVALMELLPEYDRIGVGRNGGLSGEFMAVLYRKDRFHSGRSLLALGNSPRPGLSSARREQPAHGHLGAI